uniref:Uncharacterized protein n=2 Tax=Arundo donax TaxID=35708 RepID=A0A0A9EPJ9_ARUDO
MNKTKLQLSSYNLIHPIYFCFLPPDFHFCMIVALIQETMQYLMTYNIFTIPIWSPQRLCREGMITKPHH